MSSPAEWGKRLSDRIRAALDARDFESARRLALEGDGQARSLAKEYSLMYKGLGITLRVLLDLLEETVGRRAPEAEAPHPRLLDLLRRFRQDMAGEIERAYPGAAIRQTMGALEEYRASTAELGGDVALTTRLLSHAEQLFSSEQERVAEEAVRAIEGKDAAVARALVDRKEHGQYVPLHDRFIRFMAEVFGYVLTEFGSDELYRFHLATAEGQRPGFEKWERLGPAEFAEVTAFLLKQHMGQVEVREDQEKFTVVQTPCGSGGRLKLAGAYAGPGALPFVEGPGPLTAGQERFAVYCSHCPIWNGVATIDWFGRPHWVFDNASRPDGSCTLHVYKERHGAPAAYYRLLGREPALEKTGPPG
jgi:hypothetical protein